MNNIAISAGHHLTKQTAADVLLSGGNAIDAAIAAFLVAWIAEPCMASGGGGAFANIYTANKKAYLFDFFCQTPQIKRPASDLDFFPILVDFGDTKEEFYIGTGSTATPGSIDGIFTMHQHFGTIPMKELVLPAIAAAKNGVIVDSFQGHDIGLLRPIFEASTQAASFFIDGKLVQKGDRIKMPFLADFLDYMGTEGKAAFYKGEVANNIINTHKKKGGLLTQKDFDDYKTIIRKPLSYNYNNTSVLTNPLPSIGGSILILLLHYLGKIDPKKSPKSYAHILEVYQAMKKVVRIGKSTKELYAAIRKIVPNFEYSPALSSNKHGSTSHFNIIDKWGNAVALTTTIGEGSSNFVHGTNIHMNNMLGELSLMPDGYHSWQPNIRLSSMMAPTIVVDTFGKPIIVTGSGGASRIPSAIMQVLNYLINYELPLNEATDFPRLHLEHGIFNIEYGFESPLHSKEIDDKVLAWKDTSMFFGGVHSIYKQGNQYVAKGDERRDGVALSFN